MTLSLIDSVSGACGNTDGLTFCGGRTFSIQPIDNAPMSILTSNVAAGTVTILVQSTNSAEVGTHYYTFKTNLNTYTTTYSTHTNRFEVVVFDYCN